MRNWYVLIDELTHEQECELVQLMFGVSGKALDMTFVRDCLGCWNGNLDYWWSMEDLRNACEKLSYKQAIELLEGELSDGR